MIGGDACNPALTRNVHRRLVQVTCRLEAENLFLRHQLSIALAGLSFYVWDSYLPWLSPSETSYSWRTGADRVMLLHQYCRELFWYIQPTEVSNFAQTQLDRRA
jgi:hypothetical protein